MLFVDMKEEPVFRTFYLGTQHNALPTIKISERLDGGVPYSELTFPQNEMFLFWNVS